MQFKETFEYNINGKLSTYKFYNYGINNNAVYKSSYTYNADGTVTSMRYTGDVNSQNELFATEIYTYNQGNIVQLTTIQPNGNSQNFTLTYDDKNSPYKNIPGYDVVRLTQGGGSNFNNRVTMHSDSYSATSAYEYNSNSYPVSMVNTTSLQQNYTVQYFYE